MADWICTTCRASWSKGAFTADCEECGGGALERACLVCGGRCGRTSTRAVMDSNDLHMAHWAYSCGLPSEEQWTLIKAQYERSRKPGGG